jgi:hypothetical protein
LIRPTIGLPVLMALALVAIFALAMGCGDNNRGPDTLGGTVLTPVADVPVPAGFKFKMDQSSERKSGTFRFIRHMYEGSASVRETTEFYRTSMPRNGWLLVDETLQNGRQRLLFDKGNESCHISIYDDWGTKVLIQILPKGSRPTDTKPAATPTPALKGRPAIL